MSRPVMCDTGAGMYPRSRNVYGTARACRVGTVSIDTGAHDGTLGTRRGARGEADDRRRVRVDRARRACGAGALRVVPRHPAGRVAAHDDPQGRRHPGRPRRLLEHLDVIVTAERRRSDHAVGLHPLHDRGQLVPAVDGHDRHRDRPGHPDRVGDGDRLPPVRELPDDHRAGPDVVGGEDAGDPGGGVGQLGPGDLVGVVDHRGGAAELEDIALQQVRDHDVGVEPRRAVARLETIRERCRRELHHPAPCGSLIWRTLAPRRRDCGDGPPGPLDPHRGAGSLRALRPPHRPSRLRRLRRAVHRGRAVRPRRRRRPRTRPRSATS